VQTSRGGDLPSGGPDAGPSRGGQPT
jgi:hypothetical protein